MNAFTRLLAVLPLVLGAAAISVGCGGSDGGSPYGDDDDEGCLGEQPTCSTSCGGSEGASCSGGNWICPTVESNGLVCESDGGPYGDDDGGQACPDIAPDCTFTDCDGNYVSNSPSCFQGVWECPLYNGIACGVDGGPGDDGGPSCTGPEPTCSEQDCNGNTLTTSATCLYNQWQCVALPIACIQDAGPPSTDAAPPVDAAPPPVDAGPACGSVAPLCIGHDCNGNTDTFPPTCLGSGEGWACIEPPVACP